MFHKWNFYFIDFGKCSLILTWMINYGILTKPCQCCLQAKGIFHQNVFKQEFHGSNVWRTLRSRQTNPYANRTERWLMDKELSFMQNFLEINMEAGYQYFEISIERKNKNYFQINFKRLCIKTLIFVLWIMTNVQCLHVQLY